MVLKCSHTFSKVQFQWDTYIQMRFVIGSNLNECFSFEFNIHF